MPWPQDIERQQQRMLEAKSSMKFLFIMIRAKMFGRKVTKNNKTRTRLPVFYFKKSLAIYYLRKSSLDTGIHQIVNEDSGCTEDNTSDGQTFFPILEEQRNYAKHNADDAEPEAKGVQKRNP